MGGLLQTLKGLGPTRLMAISGVDLALWDLLGKQQGLPVARLLNPQVDLQHPVPTYATVWDEKEALRQIELGMAAVKLHVERFGSPPDVEGIRVLVERTREALGAERWYTVGQSLGAALSLRYGVTHPDRVIAQAFTNSSSALGTDGFFQRIRENTGKTAETLRREGRPVPVVDR